MTFEAVLLITTVLLLTDWIKTIIPHPPSQLTPVIAAAIGIGSVMLLAQTNWADKQIINDLPLSHLNTASQILAGLLVAGGAAGIDKGLNAVRNIGGSDVPGGRPPTQ